MMQPDLSGYYWQRDRIRLRPMHREDAALWLQEDADSEAVRFLHSGMDLPKSARSAEEFADRYADFNSREERIMFSIETLERRGALPPPSALCRSLDVWIGRTMGWMVSSLS